MASMIVSLLHFILYGMCLRISAGLSHFLTWICWPESLPNLDLLA